MYHKLPEFKKWQLLFFESEDGLKRESKLAGYIYNDKRFPDGEYITTSKILSISFSDRKAKTANTEYILGSQE